MVGKAEPVSLHGDVGGQRRPRRRRLRWHWASPLKAGQHVAKVQGRGDGGRVPYGVCGPTGSRVLLQPQERRHRSAQEQPAGMAQPHLIGHE